MVTILDRLDVLRQHLDHLREIRPRVMDAESLRGDLSLRNNVSHSLLIVCQVVIDVAKELSTRRELLFEDYTEAVQNLATFPEFPSPMVQDLDWLPGLRNKLIYEGGSLDLARVVEALDRLEPVEGFAERVRQIEAAS